MKRYPFLLLVLFLLTACGGAPSEAPSEAFVVREMAGEAEYEVSEEAAEAEMVADVDVIGNQPPSDDSQASQSALNRKIIYNATLRLRVDDPRITAQSLQAVAQRYGGYISHANVYETYDDSYQADVQFRVNAEQFEAALEALRGLAIEVIYEQRDSQDVTDQYVDLQARIENLERTESELQILLTEAREKTNKTEDILSVYRELTSIREQIEVYQGQLNVLKDSVSLATINIELIAPEAPVDLVDEGWNPMTTVRTSLRNLTEGLQALADFAIVLVINILPFLIILGGVGYAFLRSIRWFRARPTQLPAATSATVE
jgi:DNA repair exonuclease SbcCD ATPase subunit